MSNSTVSITEAIPALRLRINEKLQHYLPSIQTAPEVLHQAMHYAVLNGGKRLRPTLVYVTGISLGADLATLDIPAAAIELIHSYSLIHDDLPAMDNDDLRRGQPTCHKAFDEATAILAGDALQCLAFELLTNHTTFEEALKMIKVLARASGSFGMAGGQSLDLQAEGKNITINDLENIHGLKTGCLIRASVQMGAIAARCQDSFTMDCLDHFAADIGLAFQIQDDILNIEGDCKKIGRNTGTDAQRKKATYPSISQLENAKYRVQELSEQALIKLSKIPAGMPDDMKLLQELCLHLINRES